MNNPSLKAVKVPPPVKSAKDRKGSKPYILAIASQVKENKQQLAEQDATRKQFR